MIVDSHCHLDFPELAEDRAAVLARAKASDVRTMLTISTTVARYDAIRAIAEGHDAIFFTAGTHPMHAGEEPDLSAQDYVRLSHHPKCVGIGEAGLDYHYDTVPHDIAHRVFRAQITAARETGLPIVIHARDADDDMIAILEDEMGKGAFKGVLHCFSSSETLAEAGLSLGLYLSFSGILTYKKSQEVRDIASRVSLERLLVETDAPYLAPQSKRGKRNEPAFVAETLAVLAEVKGVPVADLAIHTTDNFFRLFAKAKRPEEGAGS